MDIKEELKDVIDFLDKAMEQEPTRAIADASNTLTDILNELENGHEA